MAPIFIAEKYKEYQETKARRLTSKKIEKYMQSVK
jgi:hypothetical protein